MVIGAMKPALHKSTNGRVISLARPAFDILGRLAPELAAAAAERLFFTPPAPRRSRGAGALGTAQRFDVLKDGRKIACWRWGSGPAVLLVHGWGGQAAQLTSFVPPIVSRGFSVVAFDAPGHGQSTRGLSSAPQFARALMAVADTVGGAHAVLAHSLGAAAVALAMRDGLRVAKVVFVSPAADPPSWVAPFAARLGVAPGVLQRLRARSERRLGMRWEELRVPVLAARFDTPLLVVHDRDDTEVPLSDGAAIAAAWRGARFHETARLGHNRLLRDTRVVAEVVSFLTGRAVSTCACGAAAEDTEHCERCLLERHLFDRDLRWAES